jgi:hypothetical protein
VETRQIQTDLRSLIVVILGLLPESDERRLLAQQIALRNGMVELLNDRVGIYEGGDG